MHFGWSWRSNRVDKCRVASGGLIVLIGMASRWIQSSSRGDNFKLYIVQMSEQRSQFRKLFLVQVNDEEKSLLSSLLVFYCLIADISLINCAKCVSILCVRLL